MCLNHPFSLGFPGSSDSKEYARNAGDLGWIPRIGNGSPFQCSCLKNSMDRKRLAGYNPWGHKESDTTEQLSLALISIIIVSASFQTITRH